MADVVAILFARLDDVPRAEDMRPVVVVPFDDASDHPGAGDIVTNVLVSALVARGLPVIEPGILRDVALEKADLSRGSADHELLQALATAFDPSVVVTGTVERFRAASGPTGPEMPEIEISARAIDATSRRLLWGFTTDKKGGDSETVFGRGRCYSVGRLAGDAIAALVDPIRELGESHDVP